jgi:hypothetical protein
METFKSQAGRHFQRTVRPGNHHNHQIAQSLPQQQGTQAIIGLVTIRQKRRSETALNMRPESQ